MQELGNSTQMQLWGQMPICSCKLLKNMGLFMSFFEIQTGQV